LRRRIEIFIAGCPICEETVKLVQELACESCAVEVLDVVRDPAARAKSAQYGLKRLPAVVVGGRLAECCTQGVSSDVLRSLGVGNPL